MQKIKGLECILLVDDDSATNFIHKMVVQQANLDAHIEIATNGLEALDYLKRASEDDNLPKPGVIFLDINMPKMNGWEFLDAYQGLPENMKARIVMAMLTTSLNPDDAERAKSNENIKGFITKPLTKELLQDIVEKHFDR